MLVGGINIYANNFFRSDIYILYWMTTLALFLFRIWALTDLKWVPDYQALPEKISFAGWPSPKTNCGPQFGCYKFNFNYWLSSMPESTSINQRILLRIIYTLWLCDSYMGLSSIFYFEECIYRHTSCACRYVYFESWNYFTQLVAHKGID